MYPAHFGKSSLIELANCSGWWVLLDEINLASAETLQCLSGLLEGGNGSLSTLERGDITAVPRHPNFRLMAAMNPATDVGKKDLPPGIRNRYGRQFETAMRNLDFQELLDCTRCSRFRWRPFWRTVQKRLKTQNGQSETEKALYSFHSRHSIPASVVPPSVNHYASNLISHQLTRLLFSGSDTLEMSFLMLTMNK